MKGRLSSGLCWDSTLVVRTTVVPETVGQQVPECREQGRSNQRFEEWHPEEDRITRNDEDHRIGDDPYPHQRGNDRPYDAEREPPADNELCYKADNGRDEQVHELTLIESQMNVTQVDRDERKLTQECEHSILLLMSVYACFGRKGIQFRYTKPVLLFYTPYLLVSFQEARRTSKNIHVPMRASLLASPTLLVLNVRFPHQTPTAQAPVERPCPLLFTSDAVVMIPSGKESRYQGIFSVAYVCI